MRIFALSIAILARILMLTFPARRGTPPSYSKLLLADLVKWWNGSYIILLSLEAGKWILPAPIVSLRLDLCTTHLYWPPSLQARHLQKSMKRRPWSHKCIISSPLGPLGNLATEEGASQCLKTPQKFSILRAKRATFISKKNLWWIAFAPCKCFQFLSVSGYL